MRHSGWWLRLVLMACAAGFGLSASASDLQFRPIVAQRVERMNKEARLLYEQGLASLDRINYERALENFQQAVEKEPDNPWLRYSLVQVARYLGDTRSGADSIRYYDMAAINLKAIAESPKLNVRERERANQVLESITALRQSVIERDEKRIQFGRDIAKQYANEIYKGEQEDEEQKEKDARRKPVVGAALNKALAEGEVRIDTTTGGALDTGETRDIQAPTPETQPGAGYTLGGGGDAINAGPPAER